MPTLHIEHPITDFATWSAAFDRFAEPRRTAGCTGARVRRPVDDAAYVVIDLDFTTTAEADSFRRFLVDHVWPNREHAPGLAGEPRTMILEPVLTAAQTA